MNKMESPNKPRHVKIARPRRRAPSTSESSDSDDDVKERNIEKMTANRDSINGNHNTTNQNNIGNARHYDINIDITDGNNEHSDAVNMKMLIKTMM